MSTTIDTLQPAVAEKAREWGEWYKAAHGVNPFEPFPCFWCHEPVDLLQAYRCFECDQRFHKDCIIAHCEEAKFQTLRDIPRKEDGDRRFGERRKNQ